MERKPSTPTRTPNKGRGKKQEKVDTDPVVPTANAATAAPAPAAAAAASSAEADHGNRFDQSVRQAVATRSNSSGSTNQSRGSNATDNSNHHQNNNNNSNNGNNGSGERTYDRKAYQKSIRRTVALISLPLILALAIIGLKTFILSDYNDGSSSTSRERMSTGSSFDSKEPYSTESATPSGGSPVVVLEGGRTVSLALFEAKDADCSGMDDAIRSKACRKKEVGKIDPAPVRDTKDCPIWSRECRQRMRKIAHQHNVFDDSKVPPLGSI